MSAYYHISNIMYKNIYMRRRNAERFTISKDTLPSDICETIALEGGGTLFYVESVQVVEFRGNRWHDPTLCRGFILWRFANTISALCLPHALCKAYVGPRLACPAYVFAMSLNNVQLLFVAGNCHVSSGHYSDCASLSNCC